MVWLSRASVGIDSLSLESVLSRVLLVTDELTRAVDGWVEASDFLCDGVDGDECVRWALLVEVFLEVFSDLVLVGGGCWCVCRCVHGVAEGETSDNLGGVSD